MRKSARLPLTPVNPSQRVAAFATWLREYANGMEDGICLARVGSDPITSALLEYDSKQLITGLSEDEKLQANLAFVQAMLAHDTVQLDKFVEDPVLLSQCAWLARGTPKGIYCKNRDGINWLKQEKMLNQEELAVLPPSETPAVPNYYNLTHLKVALKEFYEGLHQDFVTLDKNNLSANDNRIQDWMTVNELPKTTVNTKQPPADAPALTGPAPCMSRGTAFVVYFGLFLVGCMIGASTADYIDGLTYESEHTDSYGRTYYNEEVAPNFFAYMLGVGAALPLLARLMVYCVTHPPGRGVTNTVAFARHQPGAPGASLAVPLLSPVANDGSASHTVMNAARSQ